MNISLIALSAGMIYGNGPLISHSLGVANHLSMRNFRVTNLFTSFLHSHSDRVKISLDNSHFGAILGSVIDVNNYYECGRAVSDPVDFPELVFLKVSNCQFTNIEAFGKPCFSFHTPTGNTIIANSLFSRCRAHGEGKVMRISTTQLRIDSICIEDSVAIDAHTSFEFDSHAYGRVIFESVSIKRAPQALERKMQVAVYGDYQRINNYNNSDSSDPRACMGLSTTYACNSDFTFCVFNNVESLSLIIANNFKETDRFSYFNFVNCTCEETKGSLLTLYEGKFVDVNHWAFSDVHVDSVIISVNTKSVILSDCNFWFDREQESLYFKGRIATRNIRYGSRDSTLVPFPIPIDESICRCTKCSGSLLLPPDEVINDVILTIICASIMIAGHFTGVLKPYKVEEQDSRML